MKTLVKQEYTSVACNRIPEIADWNEAGFICFGASNAVVIYDTNKKGGDPLTVHSHHRSLVNSVKWVRKSDGSCSELISCSADKTAAIWSLEDRVWKVTSSLTGHRDGVTCIYGIYTQGDDLVVYTGSIDSNIRVWERKNGTTELKQTINLNSGLCLTIHAHLLPKVQKPVLFCALDDHKIHIFAGNEEYHKVHTLVGHEDWVRGLDVLEIDDTTILLASASQDTYIRIWRIHIYVEQPAHGIRVEEKVFQVYGESWAVKLDAVLAGHEGWVYGVQWQQRNSDNNNRPVQRLLSSSLDKTLIIWEPEGSTSGPEGGDGAWIERVRVGEVGGNGLGFYGSRFGPGAKSFMGHGYNGSFHIWSVDEETNQWQPSVVCGGHFGAVEEARWEPSQGRYLMSVSADQTTRVHAPWRRDDGSTAWHELSRPQVHGYDMSSLALLTATTFASSAEEKVIRVFVAPHNFVTNFRNIVGEDLGVGTVSVPEGASVPSLGLSNKAVFDDERAGDADDGDGYFVPVNMTVPPTEETLIQNTLWPETQKLYGHGFEVFALAASPDGSLLASACKATAQPHAQVLIWDTKTWENTQKLTSHQLTITQLEFSPDSCQLLSVSRDRRWTLFRKVEGSEFHVEAATDRTNGVHGRIIWCCAWAHDGAMFATGSRDGKVCVWSKTDTISATSLRAHSLRGKPLEAGPASVTAVAFAPRPVDGARIVAAGFEAGIVRLYSFDGLWTMICEMDNNAAHHLTVKRLAFKPRASDDEELILASCGQDHLVRIHSIAIV